MNEQTLNYCKEFIESTENPHFALFIKGQWGAGKTYFINKLIEMYPYSEIKTESKKKKCWILNSKSKKIKNNPQKITRDQILKISLHGVTSSDEISSKMFESAYPFFSSKFAKILIRLIKTLLKFIPKADLSDLDISLQDLFSVDKKVLIVDDIERAEISINQIFGCFSQLISDSDIRVIFIGNEEKIEPSSSNFKNYLSIKEKTIGMEFLIHPDKKDAIYSFLKEFDFEVNEAFVKEKIFEVIEKIVCENMRTVRQCLYNLKLFINAFPEDITKEDREVTILNFIILFIQKSLNLINEEIEIQKVLRVYFVYNKSYSDYEKEKVEKSNNDYSDLFVFSGKTPFLNCWYEIIFNGNYDKNILTQEYINELEVIKEQAQEIKSLFEITNNWRILSKDNFEKLAKLVKREISDGKYLHPGEILLYANHFLLFSKWGLIPDSIDDINKQLDDFIYKYKRKIIPIKDWGGIDMGYASFGFSTDIPEFNSIKEKIRKLNSELLESTLKTTFENDVKTMDLSSDEFIENIIHVNGNNKYYGQPILSFIDINEFYTKMNSLPVDKQSRIISAFEERYGLRYANHPFCKEYAHDSDNIEKLYNLYKNNEKDVKYDPQELLKRDLTKRLRELYDYFKQQINT